MNDLRQNYESIDSQEEILTYSATIGLVPSKNIQTLTLTGDVVFSLSDLDFKFNMDYVVLRVIGNYLCYFQTGTNTYVGVLDSGLLDTYDGFTPELITIMRIGANTYTIMNHA